MYFIVLLQHHSSLRVSDQRPVDVAVPELVDGDLARKGAVGFVEHVLRCDRQTLAEVLSREQEVQRGRGNDDLFFLRQTQGINEDGPQSRHLPTLESNLASLRLVMMSVMDLTDPFLEWTSH